MVVVESGRQIVVDLGTWACSHGSGLNEPGPAFRTSHGPRLQQSIVMGSRSKTLALWEVAIGTALAWCTRERGQRRWRRPKLLYCPDSRKRAKGPGIRKGTEPPRTGDWGSPPEAYRGWAGGNAALAMRNYCTGKTLGRRCLAAKRKEALRSLRRAVSPMAAGRLRDVDLRSEDRFAGHMDSLVGFEAPAVIEQHLAVSG